MCHACLLRKPMALHPSVGVLSGCNCLRGTVVPSPSPPPLPHSLPNTLSCSSADDGSVYSWGRGHEGQTGQGLPKAKTPAHTTVTLTPRYLAALATVPMGALCDDVPLAVAYVPLPSVALWRTVPWYLCVSVSLIASPRVLRQPIYCCRVAQGPALELGRGRLRPAGRWARYQGGLTRVRG